MIQMIVSRCTRYCTRYRYLYYSSRARHHTTRIAAQWSASSSADMMTATASVSVGATTVIVGVTTATEVAITVPATAGASTAIGGGSTATGGESIAIGATMDGVSGVDRARARVHESVVHGDVGGTKGQHRAWRWPQACQA